MSEWIYLPADEYADAVYPDPLGPGLESAPVFCWVSNFWCPFAVMRHWHSSAENQPHKWLIDKTFYNLERRAPYHYPSFAFYGQVHAWMPLPERPSEQMQMELFKRIAA